MSDAKRTIDGPELIEFWRGAGFHPDCRCDAGWVRKETAEEIERLRDALTASKMWGDELQRGWDEAQAEIERLHKELFDFGEQWEQQRDELGRLRATLAKVEAWGDNLLTGQREQLHVILHSEAGRE